MLRVAEDSDAPRPQLFNLRDDPGELRDLAASEPDRTRRMAAAVETWFEEVNQDRKAAQAETLAHTV